MQENKYTFSLIIACAVAGMLVACDKIDEPALIEGDIPIAYIKRPVRDISLGPNAYRYGDPVTAYTFSPGGDLFLRERSSVTATTYNLTGGITQGQGDVSDPEVSRDGKKLIFSMRCNRAAGATLPDSSPACTDSWDIWEYDMTTGGLTGGRLWRLTGADDADTDPSTPLYNEVDPAYLPDGRIVFSSDRQEATQTQMNEMAYAPFSYLDENRVQQAMVLHVMDANGANITQISFNQSHDRNPEVLTSGEIMFARWDNHGDRSQYSIYKINPDGGGLEELYGSHTLDPADPNAINRSTGVQAFLHPREMSSGQILTSIMPMTGAYEGGAIAIVSPYGDDNVYSLPAFQQVPFDNGFAANGRFTTPFPLWDGSGRALVSYTPPQRQETLQGPVNGPADYRLRLLNLSDQTTVTLIKPARDVDGVSPAEMVIDTVPIMQKPPARLSITPTDNTLAVMPNNLATNTFGMALLKIRSVYYTDQNGHMDDAAIIPNIDGFFFMPRTPEGFIDIDRFKSPQGAFSMYSQRPARFLRVTRAVPTPPMQPAVPGVHPSIMGASGVSMQEILGYAEIEPDGSVNVLVPANTPVSLSVTDREGRSFRMHSSWLHFKPGEVRECKGCHEDPNTSYPLPLANHPGQVTPDETMADTRNPNGVMLQQDPQYTDYWSPLFGAAPEPAINDLGYASLPTSLVNHADYTDPVVTIVNSMAQTAFSRIVLNYRQHIQPIWETQGCAGCHDTASNVLSFQRGAADPSGWYESYRFLMLGGGGRPARVNVGDTLGGARFSRLSEAVDYGIDVNPLAMETSIPATGHSTVNGMGMTVPVLAPSVRRLIWEWMDIGAPYYSNPYGPDGHNGGPVNGISDLVELLNINE